MAQVPECVVCLQPYDDFRHVPRVLACGHSFCEVCLMQLQSAWNPSSLLNKNNDSSAAASRGAMLRCPECSHRTRLPVGGQQSLPKNVELLRLLPSLIRDTDSSTVDEAVGEKSPAGPREGFLDGKGKINNDNNHSNRAAGAARGRGDDLIDAAQGGAAGSPSTGNGGRRPKARGKGKQRVDSNPSSSNNSVVDKSWLLSCDLFSETSNKHWDVRKWILPEKAMKNLSRGGGEEYSGSSSRFRENLCGEIVLERDKSSSSVAVSLQQLTDVSCCAAQDPDEQDDGNETAAFSYEDSVLKAWEEGCSYDVKAELMILFRVSLLSRGVCNVLGIWMNDQRTALFLAVQSAGKGETVSAWEIVKESYQIEGSSSDAEWKSDDQRSTTGGGDDCLTSTTAKLCKVPITTTQQFPSSAAVAERVRVRLSRVGTELCGALSESHSQGIIFGLLSPNCFVLDRFGSLLIDFNAALRERLFLHGFAARLRNSSGSKCDSEGGRGCGSVHNCIAPEEDFCEQQEHYRNCCWRYMSPEALSLMIPSNSTETTTVGNGASSSSDKLQTLLTCKMDVWSLGCLLIEFLSGKAPYEGLTLPEVLRKVLVERQKPGNFLGLLGRDFIGERGAADCPNKGLALLLSECFAYDPDERPQLDVLCGHFLELGLWPNLATPTRGSNSTTPPESQHFQNEAAAAGSAEQTYWLFCLPGFVRKGHLDHAPDRQADDAQESQRLLSQLGLTSGAALHDRRELQPCGLEHKGSLKGHQDYVTALLICGEYMLSASFDKTIRVWSLEDNKLQQTLAGHFHTIVALAADHNTFRCISGDTGGKICVWKIGEDAALPLVTNWQEHEDWRYTGVASLAVSSDGTLYSGSGDKTVKAWSLENFQSLGIMEGHTGLVSTLLVDGELLYSGSWDGTIHVWWRTDHTLFAVLGDASSFPSLGGVRVLYMSDSFLFAGRDSGAIQVWRDEDFLATVKAHDMVVTALYVEGDFLYSGSWDKKIKAWKADRFLSGPSPTLVMECGFALSSIVSDGDQLYAGLADRAIKVYSLLGDTMASPIEMP